LKERKNIVLFFCGMLMVSLIFSPFLLTVSMLGLLVLGLTKWDSNNFKQTIGFNKTPFTRLTQYKSYASFGVLFLYFFIVLFSAWQTDGDWHYWLERIRIKLPFIALPIAFLGFLDLMIER